MPADVAASVIVLQSLFGLSDRDAVAALRYDLRWKVASFRGGTSRSPRRTGAVLSLDLLVEPTALREYGSTLPGNHDDQRRGGQAPAKPVTGGGGWESYLEETSMATMRAARFNQDAQELTVRDVPLPNLTPLDVLVRVQACGICLSDVHLIDGTLPSLIPEVTPGHEAAGYVERVGDLVRGWQPGDRVVLAGGRPCLGCRNCVRGRFEECWDPQVMGFGYDGAWAEYVAVPGTALAEVPEHVPIEQAAILADAVATPYAALTDRGALRPGQSVGLWGIGGLGVHAVQIARMAGAAPIIAVDPSKAARVRALDRGADVALDPGGTDVVADVLRLSDGGLDLAVDLVGANAVLAEAAACLGRFGRVVMVGLSMDRCSSGPAWCWVCDLNRCSATSATRNATSTTS